MSDYVKIRKQILVDIADAIRLQKETTKLYKPTEFANVIRKLLCLPSAEAVSTISNWGFEGDCIGILPTIYKATATSTITGMTFASTVSGILVEENEITEE